MCYNERLCGGSDQKFALAVDDTRYFIFLFLSVLALVSIPNIGQVHH